MRAFITADPPIGQKVNKTAEMNASQQKGKISKYK